MWRSRDLLPGGTRLSSFLVFKYGKLDTRTYRSSWNPESWIRNEFRPQSSGCLICRLWDSQTNVGNVFIKFFKTERMFQVEMSRPAKLSARAKRHLADGRKMDWQKKNTCPCFLLNFITRKLTSCEMHNFLFGLYDPVGCQVALSSVSHVDTCAPVGWKAEHTWLKFQIGWRLLIFINIPLFSEEHHLTGDVRSHWSLWLKTSLPWIFNQITKLNDFLC